MKHIIAVLIFVFSLGYHGKTIGFEKYNPYHRTTVAHFLNKGKWDGATLEDTISSKTKPSSRALHPIEDAYFPQSQLKGKKDYGHISSLKTNRILYPCGIKQKVREFALHLRKTDTDVSLVTVCRRTYYVYPYEGSLNCIGNVVILISYPKDVFYVPKALQTSISTDISLSTRDILDKYVERWQWKYFSSSSRTNWENDYWIYAFNSGWLFS